MSIPSLPGARQGSSQADKPPPAFQTGLQTTSSSAPAQYSAADRAVQIQGALKGIVLQTAYALRSRAELAKLNASGSNVLSRGITSNEAADQAATSLEPLGAECAQYLALVRGLRDYLLHAQAALEMELEAAVQRETKQTQDAAEALKKKQQQQQNADLAQSEQGNAEPKPSESSAAINGMKEDSAVPAISKARNSGTEAGEAIVIESDGNDGDEDDEDDIPLALAPQTGATEASSASKPVDLTDSPNTVQPSATDAPMFTIPGQTSEPGLTNTNTGLGLSVDLSSIGMNLDNLSSFDMPTTSLPGNGAGSASSENNLQDLGKMMGIDMSSFGGQDGSMGTGMDDISAFTNLASDSIGDSLLHTRNQAGDSNDMDFFGANDNGGGLDLSSFDFSSLGGEGEFGGSGNNGGGVDLSAFLNTFGAGQGDQNHNST